MAIQLSDLGIIRCATPTDAQALSRLMATHGTEALPLTAADLAAWRRRGPLLVLELADGSLGGVAAITPSPAGDVRYLAVNPTLGRRGMITSLAHARAARPDRALARRASYITMMVLSLPGLVLTLGRDPASLAIFVWAGLALLTAARTSRIPRAIVRRRRTQDRLAVAPARSH
jgi:hypothetical protein